MKRKRTAARTTAIKRGRQAGKTIAEIAAEQKLSVATVHAALATSKPPKKGASKASAKAPSVLADPGDLSAEAEPPPTREELVALLVDQAKSLRADVAAATEPTTRAAANRNLVAVQALITRCLPPTPLDPDVGTFVSGEEMREAAGRVRKRWHDLIDKVPT